LIPATASKSVVIACLEEAALISINLNEPVSMQMTTGPSGGTVERRRTDPTSGSSAPCGEPEIFHHRTALIL
jgi:hypothetical protein